uniref:Transmembrane p24 trafficking protein 1b n=1 Tax=Hucho hucho TaxID=62062 RepID=A0A4W5N7Q3_9TELE
MDVDFTVLSPHGLQLVSEFHRSDGVHMSVPLPRIGPIYSHNISSSSAIGLFLYLRDVTVQPRIKLCLLTSLSFWFAVGFVPTSLIGCFLCVSASDWLFCSRVEPTEEGDYQICFDNSFSRFSEKMVFFEVIIEGQPGDLGGDDEWAGLGEPESLLEYKLEDIRESIDSVHRRLERSRQMQTVLRAFEARDRNLLEDNLWRVSFWSCTSLIVMLGVALTQVYTVRRLFDDRRRVCT